MIFNYQKCGAKCDADGCDTEKRPTGSTPPDCSVFGVQIKDCDGDWFWSVATDGRYKPLKFKTEELAKEHMERNKANPSWNGKVPTMRVRPF